MKYLDQEVTKKSIIILNELINLIFNITRDRNRKN